MGKKNKKKGKKKPGPTNPQDKASRLESRLLNYWKKSKYGEFITLYSRHIQAAENTSAREYLNSAAYNLLTKTLFEDQDQRLLQEFLNTLSQIPGLSQEIFDCLQVARTTLNVFQSRASLKELSTLPKALPQPYQSLANGLNSLTDLQKQAPLNEYLQGKRKKARKGEKRFALAARLAGNFASLEQQDFNPSSTTPYTQIKNCFQELKQAVQQSSDISNPVLQDSYILAELIRELKAKKHFFSSLQNLVHYLRKNQFQYSRHPIVLSLLNCLFQVGKKNISSKWAFKARLLLAQNFPELQPEMDDHIKAQFDYASDLFFKQKIGNLDKGQILDNLLQGNVWSQREIFFLNYSKLYFYSQKTLQLLEEVPHYHNPLDFFENSNKVKRIIKNSNDTLLTLLKIRKELGKAQKSSPEEEIKIWENILLPFPIASCKQEFAEVANEIVQFPLSASRYMFLICKLVQEYWPVYDFKVFKKLQDKPNLSLTEEDLKDLSNFFFYSPNKIGLLNAWTNLLQPEQNRKIAEYFVWELYYQATKSEFLFFLRSDEVWFDFSREVMNKLLNLVGDGYPLRGLMLMTVRTPQGSAPTPKKKADAKPFLDNLPEPDTLYSLILWMLSWPRSRYSPDFFEALIKEVIDYATKIHGWSELTRAICLHGSNALAAKVWGLWTETDLFNSLHMDPDFKAAQEDIRPMVINYRTKANKKGKKSDQKETSGQKTLLDEIFRELNKRKKNRK